MLYEKRYLFGFIPYYVVATHRNIRDYVVTVMWKDNEMFELLKKIDSYENLKE